LYFVGTAGGITVSLNKRGRWDLLKSLKQNKGEKKKDPRDKAPQYFDTPKGTSACAGGPDPEPRDKRPAFLHKIRTIPASVWLRRSPHVTIDAFSIMT
jgi:hypothetical protein